MYKRRTWDEERRQEEGGRGECTEEKCWAALFPTDGEDSDDGTSLEEIVPDFEVGIAEGTFHEEDVGRKKSLMLSFFKKWKLEIRFTVEKKNPHNARDAVRLVNIASRAVAGLVKDKEDLDLLEIPATLRRHLADSFTDLVWRRGDGGSSSRPDSRFPTCSLHKGESN